MLTFWACIRKRKSQYGFSHNKRQSTAYCYKKEHQDKSNETAFKMTDQNCFQPLHTLRNTLSIHTSNSTRYLIRQHLLTPSPAPRSPPLLHTIRTKKIYAVISHATHLTVTNQVVYKYYSWYNTRYASKQNLYKTEEQANSAFSLPFQIMSHQT